MSEDPRTITALASTRLGRILFKYCQSCGNTINCFRNKVGAVIMKDKLSCRLVIMEFQNIKKTVSKLGFAIVNKHKHSFVQDSKHAEPLVVMQNQMQLL